MNRESRLIDTNVLVYAYDISEKVKRRIARALLDEVWDQGGGVVTLQNLSEFFVVVTKKVENPTVEGSAAVSQEVTPTRSLTSIALFSQRGPKPRE
jgi:predicted nucleic acid-binding protein